MLTLDFGLCGHWIFVKWTLGIGWADVRFLVVDVGFWLCGCWILVVWTLDFDWVDVGCWLCERWIYVIKCDV